MQSSMLRAARLLGALATACLWLAASGLVLMTALIAWQVFSRYMLNDTPTWTETVSIILMTWFIFLGAAVGVREGNHLNFDILLHVVPERARAALNSISDLVVLAFGLGMAIYGGQLTIGTWGTPLPNLGWPTGVTYLAIVAGGVLIVLFSAERLARRAAGLSTAGFGHADTVEAEI